MEQINLEFPKLYPKQLEVFQACMDESSGVKYIVVNGSRQVGKTKLLSCVALYWAMSKPSQHIMVVSFTDSQVQELQTNVQLILGDAFNATVSECRVQVGKAYIEFKNKSRILFRSSGSEQGLRGFSNTHLIIDEASFVKEETFSTILLPTLSVMGKFGKVLLCSTPKGQNFFHKLYMNGINNFKKYKSFKILYNDNPYADAEFIEHQKSILPEGLFRQEYLGEFIDSTGVFQNIDEIATFEGQKSFTFENSYYTGIDIGLRNDATVIVTFNHEGKMVDMVRLMNTDTLAIQNAIIAANTKWSPRRIVIEANGQGLPVIMNLRLAGIQNIEEFYTTEQSKSDAINKLIAAANLREITLLNNDVVKEEFKSFCATLSSSGKVKFQASHGSHDDIVMATCLAWTCRSNFQYRESFMF